MGFAIQTSAACGLQAFLLRNYLKNVWLYAISTVVGSLISGILSINVAGITNLSFVLYGVGTGLALLWLDHITYEQVEDGIVANDM